MFSLGSQLMLHVLSRAERSPGQALALLSPWKDGPTPEQEAAALGRLGGHRAVVHLYCLSVPSTLSYLDAHPC